MKAYLTATMIALMTTSMVHANQSALEKNLKKEFPEINTKILGTTPVKEVYEVLIGENVVYTDQNARYFFVGQLIDFKNKENLTAKREKQLTQVDVSTLPTEQAIKSVKGDGTRKLYVFSDPDCPYCKKLEQNLTNIDNVTIYTFLFPLKNLHPNAENVAKQIWCSSNPYEAWEEYMILNNPPSALATCDNPVQKNINLGRNIGVTGTPTLFFQDGTRVSGAMSHENISKMLDEIK